MPFGKFRKRKKSGSFRKRSKRAFKTNKRINYSKQVKRLGVLRILLLILILLVLIAGISVPLVNYFIIHNNNPYAEESNGEYFSEEQQQQLLQTVNRNSPLEKDYIPMLTQVKGVSVNALMKDDLEELLTAAENDGIGLQMSSGYISFEEQNKLYEEMYNSIKEQNNVTSIKAESGTVKIVPKAGQSEAQTGLIVVFSDSEEKDFEKSKSCLWLRENAVEYGFVLRYPKDKEDLTFMTYNPSTYRFVGKNNALKMRIFGMCMEEYREYTEQK